MKILLSVILVTLAAAAHPAAAGAWSDFVRFEAQGQGRPGGLQRPRERETQAPERPDRGPRREGRLTEEERRDLRRDIDRANREIYKGRRER